MKKFLQKKISGKSLSRLEAKIILQDIFLAKYNDLQATAFIMAYCMKLPNANELKGFHDAMLEQQRSLDFSSFNTVDVCGTGGDNKNTFNISTLTAFVVAAGGEKVVKHGNYGVSSNCGSSNVLEYLGYNFQSDQSYLSQSLEKYNFCYLHAPLFNPVMKNITHIRQNLGVKTFFNLLGPLINPSNPGNQLIGVSELAILYLYQELLKNEKVNFSLIHSLDGYDEISLTSEAKVLTKTKNTTLSPESFNLSQVKNQSLFGGNNIKESVEIFIKILKGKGTPSQNDVVCANAALAFQLFDTKLTLKELVLKAKEILLSGKSYKVLKNVLNHA